MQRFPWRFAVYLAAGIYLFIDLIVVHGPAHRRLTTPRGVGADSQTRAVAMVFGRPVTSLELAEALRDHLWKRAEDWDSLPESARATTRRAVLEQMVNERLLRDYRVMNRLKKPVPSAEAAAEVDYLRRQFVSTEEWERRLALQALSAEEIQERGQAALEAALWVEEKIAHRLAEITDDLVREWFEENAGGMRVPERFRAEHLFLSNHEEGKGDREAEMLRIRALLTKDGANFAELIREHSEDERTKGRGGDLGWFSAARMPPEFMTAVSSQSVGEVGQPVKTGLGWHLIRVTDRRASRLPEFEEAREEVRALLMDERRGLAVRSLIAELRERSTRPTKFLFYDDEAIAATAPAPTTHGVPPDP
jgi:parvulin-like peptidyl-prolyl isomerase